MNAGMRAKVLELIPIQDLRVFAAVRAQNHAVFDDQSLARPPEPDLLFRSFKIHAPQRFAHVGRKAVDALVRLQKDLTVGCGQRDRHEGVSYDWSPLPEPSACIGLQCHDAVLCGDRE